MARSCEGPDQGKRLKMMGGGTYLPENPQMRHGTHQTPCGHRVTEGFGKKMQTDASERKLCVQRVSEVTCFNIENDQKVILLHVLRLEIIK